MEPDPLRVDAIVTRRLLLRPPHRDDAEDIARLLDNPRVSHMLTRVPHPYTHADAKEFLGVFCRNRDNHVFAVARLSDGAFMGICSLDPRYGDNQPTLGYWLGEPFWGHGYATEAAQAVADLGFGALNKPSILSSCLPENRASRHVLEKCGFIFAGTEKATSLALGREVTFDSCALSRAQWLERRLASPQASV